MQNFTLGQIVSYKHHTGYINFIDREYITICIRQYPNSYTKNNLTQVLLVIHQPLWSLIHFSTENAEIVENY